MPNLSVSDNAVLSIDSIRKADGGAIDKSRTAGELSVDVKYSLAACAALEEEDNYMCEKKTCGLFILNWNFISICNFTLIISNLKIKTAKLFIYKLNF